MLRLMAGSREGFDDSTNKFTTVPGHTLVLMEHSLVSLSKWEEIWEKSFLSDDKTGDEWLDYIRLMILPGQTLPDIAELLTQQDVEVIKAYIESEHSATTITERQGQSTGTRQRLTSEQIYSWMVGLQIDWRAETWNLNRLLKLIRLVNNANTESSRQSGVNKRVTGSDQLAARRALNEQRRAAANSTG